MPKKRVWAAERTSGVFARRTRVKAPARAGNCPYPTCERRRQLWQPGGEGLNPASQPASLLAAAAALPTTHSLSRLTELTVEPRLTGTQNVGDETRWFSLSYAPHPFPSTPYHRHQLQMKCLPGAQLVSPPGLCSERLTVLDASCADDTPPQPCGSPTCEEVDCALMLEGWSPAP